MRKHRDQESIQRDINYHTEILAYPDLQQETVNHHQYWLAEAKKEIRLFLTRDIPLGLLEDISIAVAEGRNVVLPCMAGDTVFVLQDGYEGKRLAETVVTDGVIDHFTIGGLGVPVADISTADRWLVACSDNEYYLTREAAAAALEADQTYDAYLIEAKQAGAIPHTPESWRSFKVRQAMAAIEGKKELVDGIR